MALRAIKDCRIFLSFMLASAGKSHVWENWKTLLRLFHRINDCVSKFEFNRARCSVPSQTRVFPGTAFLKSTSNVNLVREKLRWICRWFNDSQRMFLHNEINFCFHTFHSITGKYFFLSSHGTEKWIFLVLNRMKLLRVCTSMLLWVEAPLDVEKKQLV